MNRQRSAARAGMRRGTIIVGVAALVLGACGGSSKKAATPTTTEAAGQGTTVPILDSPATEGDVIAATTATTATTEALRSATTAVTVKPRTATTLKKTTATAPAVNKSVTATPAGGLTNVTAAPTTVPNASAQPGGTIKFLKAGEIVGLDPIRLTNSGTSDGPAAFSIYDVLVFSEGGAIKPQTAQSLTSTDGTVWTLKVRPNIKFTDGTAYDAAAVKFNLARLQDPKNAASRASQANMIATMDVVDATTLRIGLKATYAVFPQALNLMPFVGSPTAIQALGNDKFNSAPIGAGPFMLKSWSRDSDMVLQRNPNYWNAPLPYLDQVVITPIIDESQRMNTFCAGGANMSYIGTVGNADQLQKQGCGVSKPIVLNGGIDMLFNTTKAPMNDPRVRQAVAMAIDFTDYSKVIDNGVIPPTRSVFRPDSPFYDAGILQPAFNPTQAQQLFDAAAADVGGTINIQLSTFPTPGYLVPAQYLQAVLNKFNHVKVDVVSEASGVHITNCNGRSFSGICLFAVLFDDPEPAWTGLFTCAAAPSQTGYCNAKFDAAVAANQVDLDVNQRITDIKNAQKQFYADVPALFIELTYRWTFVASNVQDYTYVNDGLPLLDRLWIKSHN